ncbi:hypothetical protein Bbelb_002890 [Branchiostoma belcheri]|nr:hypothetical protein Bbelb_002890 [Branchiostoma belcheri]
MIQFLVLTAFLAVVSADSACDNIGGTCLDWRYYKCTAGYEIGLCSGDSNRRCCNRCGSGCISDEDYWATYSDGACDGAGGECKDDSNYCNGHYNTGMCGGPSERKCCLPHGTSGGGTSGGGGGGGCTVRAYSNNNFVGDPIHVEDGFRGAMDSINSAAGRCGVKVWITHSWRKLGAFIGGAIVQPASNSNHLVGHAIDMNIQRSDGSLCNGDCLQGQWDNAANCFLDEVIAAGLTWGGVFNDPVHIDDRYNTNLNRYYDLRDVVQPACGHIPMT